VTCENAGAFVEAHLELDTGPDVRREIFFRIAPWWDLKDVVLKLLPNLKERLDIERRFGVDHCRPASAYYQRDAYKNFDGITHGQLNLLLERVE
ncbi:MAG: hypothetical protein O7E52_16320, partial [Candidatus Poribacteria bacterium]|nr:hypothetical protein [Candidatus Poribacteria bacterium]